MSTRSLAAKLAALALTGSLLVPGAALADGTSIYFHYGYPSFPVVEHYYVPPYSGYYCPPGGYHNSYNPYWNWGGHNPYYGHGDRKHHYGHYRHKRHDHHQYHRYTPPSHSYYEPRRHNRVQFGVRHRD